MATMKTPGVYIVEKNAFPNSVVEVATAVPVFIGYTAKADNNGSTLAGRPWRISSLAEFITYFGGAPTQEHVRFSLVAKQPEAAKQPVALGARDEEALVLGGSEYWLQQAAGKYLLYYAMQTFFQNGGGPCWVVSVGKYGEDVSGDKLAADDVFAELEKETEPTLVVVPDAVVLKLDDCIAVQQAVLKHCGYTMRSRFAILDVWEGYRKRSYPDFNCINVFRDKLGVNQLDFGAAYYPWVKTSVVSERELSYLNLDDDGRTALVACIDAELLRAAGGIPNAKYDAQMAEVNRIKPQTDEEKAAAQAAQAKSLDEIAAKAEADAKTAGKTDEEAARIKAQARAKAQAQADADAKASAGMLLKTLPALSAAYAKLQSEMAARLSLLPPSAAMAGIYTMVDNTRGVWKAPANVSLNGVVGPAVALSNAEQEDLNVTPQGKSINALRSFVGEGTLVWGARTLDGNSLDWRYVNVRRTMLFLEESVRLAAKALVFEPNVSTTWVTIKSMIGSFLNSVWKRGGLAGASPEDAFSVFVGLGETMTPEDILEGILRVTVLVAISRPAEFIEITFQQQMQKS